MTWTQTHASKEETTLRNRRQFKIESTEKDKNHDILKTPLDNLKDNSDIKEDPMDLQQYLKEMFDHK